MLKLKMVPGKVLIFLLIVTVVIGHEDASVYEPGLHGQPQFGSAKPVRYLLYDVNPGEGFNLRRDVYMRVANLVKTLNDDGTWILVLPPWGRLYHWKSTDIYQIQIPWSKFFDVPSLNRHIPVIEFEDYLKTRSEPSIGEIWYLQSFKEGWRNGKWEERLEKRDCNSPTGYHEHEGKWYGWFWGYEDVYGLKFKCISVQGHAAHMKPQLYGNTTANSVLILRFEQLLHDVYGESMYWNARRSMVYAKTLRDVADQFRKDYLDSTDESDKTKFDDDWTAMRRKHGDAKGGPYVAVHLRRRDFLYGRSETVPSLEGAANKTREILEKYQLKTVFVATDSPKSEFQEFRDFLSEYKVVKYTPTKAEQQEYLDGGVAIIDQWISAHARYFIGTSESTFSFRIQEDREILGFDSETTFNRFCGDKEEKPCEGPSKWYIRY